MSSPSPDITPVPLMQLSTGFWSFKTLAAAVELDLFTKLAGGREVSVLDLQQEFDMQHRPADLLLAACASLGLLEKAGDRYRNTELSETFLVQGRPYYFGGFVRFCDAREYPAWHRIVDALRGNRPTTWDPSAGGSLFDKEDPVMLGLFWEAMHSFSTFTARALGEKLDFQPYRRLLDVGGGSGAFPIELCKRHGHLEAAVYDLPHACAIAASKIEAAGLSRAIGTIAGDFVAQDLPAGFDVMLVSHILHDWDEAHNRKLLGKIHAALPAGGDLIISELMLDDTRDGPPAAALMGMNMLVETIGGKNYSEAEYRTWLTDAGFGDFRSVALGAAGANKALVARKR